jgi:nitroimidazol reductase NimA-like FMN-containing flavoprotein (pyridoxamine 5'-phosphate oxidase superfamily)
VTRDHAQLLHAILDGNEFMTLATADADGTPWASPVWFCAGERAAELYWVSRPGSRHSRNIAQRPEVAVVVFDSRVRPGEADALYMEARARELDGAELQRGIAIFSAASVARLDRAWTIDDVQPPAELRLYRADVAQHWLLDPDRTGIDRREPVNP